jgi:general stress protein 26
MTQHDASSKEALWEIVKDIRFAIFTTKHSNGHLHGRPMTTQNKSIDEDESLWFFMSRSSDTVEDLTEEPTVHVGYADPDRDAYVSVSGTAAVVEDRAKKEQLWSKMTEAWFPKGIDDPDLALVRVQIAHAEYWDVKDSKPVQLFKMAKAAVTGKPPDMGEHGRVRMN